jgi:DNA-binding IscR family transcriptional regulator
MGDTALAEHPARIVVSHIFTALEGPISVFREQVPRGGIDFFWDKIENKLKNHPGLFPRRTLQPKTRTPKQLHLHDLTQHSRKNQPQFAQIFTDEYGGIRIQTSWETDI